MNWKEIWKEITRIGKFFGPPIILSWILMGRTIAGRHVSVKMSVITTLALVIIWLIWFLIRVAPRVAQTNRRLEGIERERLPQKSRAKALSAPEALVEMEEKISRVVASLKKVPIEKRGPLKLFGIPAPYRLPWYLVMGPPGCGKTTLLRNSGVQFTVVPQIEATQNCDWFLADQAIILDTAGRYATHDDEESNKSEWLGLLTLLKKYRKRRPINGVIVAINVDSILLETEEQNEQKARRIRARLDELIEQFDINFPVYLVFTKCDCLYGFTQFFGDLKAVEECVQMWGCTFTRQPDDPEKDFKAECQKLYQSLDERKLVRLASGEIDLKKNRAIYLFPLEFREAFQTLTEFVGKLFRSTAYREEKPMFRGFYFTSGTQEGDPFDLVFQRVVEEFNTHPRIPIESPMEMQTYFIKDLLTRIIFGDQALARGTAKAKRRFWLKRLALATVAFVMSAVLILIPRDGARDNEMTAFIHANRPIESVRVDDWPVDERKIIKRSDNQWIIPLSGGKPHKIRVRTSKGEYPPKTVTITYDGEVVNFP